MEYRQSKTGEPISILGYGCMRFTTKGGSIDIDKAEKEIMAAYKAGVNYFDTAYVYSGSEAALGEILERNGIRDKIRLATKLPQYLIRNRAGLDKYFDEQLERIREIRASERLFYQKITDIYATAVDYDKTAAATKRFYATVQNKMHYAVHGHTAAELIVERADHTKEHMGLTTWSDAPDGKIKKSDVVIAKNYLSQEEMGQLNRMVSAYLDYAENMAARHIPLTMADWETRLNRFIEMFEYGLLNDVGKVTAEIAKLHAESEFEKYRVIQDKLFMSDYDRYMLELEEQLKLQKKNKPTDDNGDSDGNGQE